MTVRESTGSDTSSAVLFSCLRFFPVSVPDPLSLSVAVSHDVSSSLARHVRRLLVGGSAQLPRPRLHGLPVLRLLLRQLLQQQLLAREEGYVSRWRCLFTPERKSLARQPLLGSSSSHFHPSFSFPLHHNSSDYDLAPTTLPPTASAEECESCCYCARASSFRGASRARDACMRERETDADCS